jgi:hypothetical protein
VQSCAFVQPAGLPVYPIITGRQASGYSRLHVIGALLEALSVLFALISFLLFVRCNASGPSLELWFRSDLQTSHLFLLFFSIRFWIRYVLMVQQKQFSAWSVLSEGNARLHLHSWSLVCLSLCNCFPIKQSAVSKKSALRGCPIMKSDKFNF